MERIHREPLLLHITTVPQSLAFVRGQVTYMTRRGFKVYALSSPGTALERFALNEPVHVQTVAMARAITPLRDAIAVIRIYRFMRRVRPHIVHSHTPKGGLLGMVCAWLAGVPVRIYHVHGLPFMTARGPKRLLLFLTERISCFLAHQVYCVSWSIRQVIVERGLCPPKKITVLRHGSSNGVDAEVRFNPDRLSDGTRSSVRQRFGIPDDALVLGFIGRVVRDKGVIELAQAWRDLRDDFSDLWLLIVGPLESQDRLLQETLESLARDPRVCFAGEVMDTSEVYTAIDVVVLPSYREGFPNVPLEAAAMCLPVVATRIPGCSDSVQDRVTGLLVPVRDPVALSEALRTYIQDKPLRYQHGNNGRERVLRDFRPQDIWEGFLGGYVKLLRAKHVLDTLELREP